MLQIEFTDPLQVEALALINQEPVVIAENSDLDSIAERLSAVIGAVEADSVVEAYYGILEAFSFALDLTEMPRENGDLIASLIPLHYWR